MDPIAAQHAASRWASVSPLAPILAIALSLFAAPIEAATPHRGEQIGEWTIVHVTEHPEFVRLRLERGDEQTEIEFTSRAISGAEEARAQPAPDAAPLPELLELASAWMAERGAIAFTVIRPELGAEPIACGRGMPGGRSGPVRTVPPLWSVVLAALWLALVAVTLAPCAARCLARPRPALLAEAAIAALVGVFTAVALAMATGVLGPNTDTVRDLAIGLECRSGLQCLCGASATHAGLWQGTAWPRFVALTAGDRLANLSIALGVLDALAAGLLFGFVRRTSGVALAVGAVVLWAGALLVSGELWIPWNPSLQPLTGVAFALAVAAALRRPGFGATCLAGAAAALVVESHIAGWGVVGTWFVVSASDWRQMPTAAAGATTCFAVHWLLSPGTVVSNVATVHAAVASVCPPAALLAAAGVVLALVWLARAGMARRLAARGDDESADARRRVELGAWSLAVAPALAAALIAATTDWWLSVRYLLPGLGLLVVALSLSLARLGPRARVVAASALCAVGVASLVANARPGFRERAAALQVVDEISAALAELPSSLDAFEDVQSPDPRLVAAIATARNLARETASDRDDPQVAMTLDWDERWVRVGDETGAGLRVARTVAPARVDRGAGLVCAADGARCVTLASLRRALPMAPNRSSGALLDFAPAGLVSSFRFPVAPSPEATRVVLFDRTSCAFRVRAGEGLEPVEPAVAEEPVDRAAPGASAITIPPTSGEAWIVVDIVGDCLPSAPPTWREQPAR